MVKLRVRLLALLLALALLLSGCSMDRLETLWYQLGNFLGMSFVTTFDEMEYTRPDMDAMEEKLAACLTAMEEEASAEELMESVWNFYACYNSFYTEYYLANIHYYKDLTDIYWSAEYEWCMEQSAKIDAALEELYYALAACPMRQTLEEEGYFAEGFLAAYEGESIWSDELIALLEEEARLVSEYYEVNAASAEVPYYSEAYFTTYGTQLLDIYTQLVRLRQQIAQHAGFEDYPTYAYAQDFYRDYTPQQAQTYFEQVQQELVPIYRETDIAAIVSPINTLCNEEDAFFYVKSCAKALGGAFEEAFRLMEAGQLYDISYGENKHEASFEVFLPSYMEPYIYVCPSMNQRDKLTFAHEFGHFTNDYISNGTTVDVDVAEIFSQSVENLSLLYADGGEALTEYRMLSVLATYVEQAAYASFEYNAYMLPAEEVTAENILAVYEKTGKDYGFDSWNWDPRDLVAIPHFFIAPMYISSYVLSNDVALQVYQLELEETGAGVALLEAQLATQESYLLAFLEQAELESPFTEGRIQRVAQTIRSALQ